MNRTFGKRLQISSPQTSSGLLKPGAKWASSASAIAIAVSSVASLGFSAASAQEQAGAAGAGRSADDEIIVTGSLISRSDYTAMSPISTIGGDSLDAAGQPSLDVAFGQLPQFAAAQGAAEVGDAQVNIGFSGGQSNSDLRGLGINRSLVLMDGRRLMPSSPDGSIDLNTIPKSLIQNVEIVTGGASAAYGSEAIAGVVNFRLKRNFSGLQLNYRYGSTTHGDGETQEISAIAGGDFADDRGHALFAIEFADRNAVLGSDRSFFSGIRQLARPPEGIIAPGGFGGGAPTIDAVNQALAAVNGGMIAGVGSDPFLGSIGINTDGSLFTTGAAPNCVQNYQGLGPKGLNISADCTKVQVALGQFFAVLVPLERYNAFASADYDLNEHVKLYGQFNFSQSKSLSVSGAGSSKPSIPLIVPLNSPFVTGNAALQTVLGSISPATSGPIVLTKLMSAFGDRTVRYDTTTWQATGGASGDIPSTPFTWDIYGAYGRSLFTNTFEGDISLSAINSILDGTANFQGQTGSCAGFAWNPFGNNPISAACAEFAGRTETNIDELVQWQAQGTVQGPVFTLPAGEVSIALGGDYRRFYFDFRPDSEFVAKDSLAFGTISAAGGAQSVREVFGELFIPVLADMPLAEEFSLSLGYRYSKYNDISGRSTWKTSANWEPVEGLAFRGGYSRAIRAPSPFDLFGPTSRQEKDIGVPPFAGDPCDVGTVFRTGPDAAQVAQLCQAQGVPAALLPTYTLGSASTQNQDGSNPDLQPEKANSWTVGMVATPEIGAIPGRLQASIDYYNIKIEDAIGILSNTEILKRCFNSDGVSNPTFSVDNAFCQRVTRNPATGGISLIESGRFNFQTLTTAGIDFQIDYSLPLDGESSLRFNSIFTYLRRFEVAGLLGSPTLDYAGSIGFGLDSGTQFGGDISHPEWKGNTSVTYNYGPFAGTWRWRYINSMTHSDVVANPSSTTPGVPAFNYFDFDARYDVNDNVRVGFSFNNITNKKPPRVAGAPLTTDAALYDVIGRTFHLSARVTF